MTSRLAATSYLVFLASLGSCAMLAGCSSLPGPYPAASSAASPVSEVRLGAFEHDAMSPERGSVDLSGEVLFDKPWTSKDPLWNALLPRPDIGGTANFAGKTSEAYAGVAWDYDVTDRIFAEGAFGGSVNNGYAGKNVPPGHNAMGCNESFRESASLGYRLTANWNVLATVEHMSNAGFCDENRGLTNAGARIGYAF